MSVKLVCSGKSRRYPSVTAKVYRRGSGEYSVEARHRSYRIQLDGYASAIDAFAEGLRIGEGRAYTEDLFSRCRHLPPYPYR